MYQINIFTILVEGCQAREHCFTTNQQTGSFQWPLGHFVAVFVTQKVFFWRGWRGAKHWERFQSVFGDWSGYFWGDIRRVSSCVWGTNPSILRPFLFRTPTKCFFVPKPNQTLSTAFSQHKIETGLRKHTEARFILQINPLLALPKKDIPETVVPLNMGCNEDEENTTHRALTFTLQHRFKFKTLQTKHLFSSVITLTTTVAMIVLGEILNLL